jgi:hypothetical protein
VINVREFEVIGEFYIFHLVNDRPQYITWNSEDNVNREFERKNDCTETILGNFNVLVLHFAWVIATNCEHILIFRGTAKISHD